MKHDKKQYPRILMSMLFIAAFAAMVHGCTLEDLLAGFAVDSEGNYITCSNLQQIMILSNQHVITYVRAEFEGEFADVFGMDVCPVAAPNCMHEGEGENKAGICNNCPKNHAVCKDKCVDIINPNLHIHNCGSDNLECKNGYYDLNDDASDGCEINGWTDNAHCGAGVIDGETRKPGRQCEDYEVCTRGECAENCGDENYMLVCGSQCVNTNIDNAHCGGCNATCSITANDVRAAVACQDGGCHAIACQPGYYLADADEVVGAKVLKTCKPCADGKYTTSATATECEECKTTTGAKSMVFDAENNICRAETCLEGYKLVDGQCEPCAAGSVSFNGQCMKCQAGTYAKGNECTSCPAGSYCPTAGLISPIDCPKGHYCPKSITEPTPCPKGTYRNTKNGKSEHDCSNCPKGTHNDGYGAQACAVIPAGYVGINCRDESNKIGCVHYSMCFEGNSVTKCSNMYGGGVRVSVSMAFVWTPLRRLQEVVSSGSRMVVLQLSVATVHARQTTTTAVSVVTNAQVVIYAKGVAILGCATTPISC